VVGQEILKEIKKANSEGKAVVIDIGKENCTAALNWNILHFLIPKLKMS